MFWEFYLKQHKDTALGKERPWHKNMNYATHFNSLTDEQLEDLKKADFFEGGTEQPSPDPDKFFNV